MAATNRKAIAGSIHRIREFELEKVCLAEEFDILQIVGEGWFGKILLVEHRGTDTEMVLKALPKPYVALRDFYREFHYGLHLGAHKNIITTYDVAFETAGFYVFSQEYAPLGDLTSNVSDTGIGELHTKRVAKQLAAALDHLHARDLVHRDVKLDNILVFKSDFSRIKLCDFGETRKSQTVIRRRNEWLPYSPPEVLQTAVEDTYKAVTSHDVWQFGIVIFVCLTGCLPWQKAALDDPRYVRYLNWYNTSNPLRKQPKLFKLVSSRAQRLFKKCLEPRPDKRSPGLGDLQKYMDDRWMAKGINEKNGTAGTEVDELCPSMYSFHSDIDEKNKLLHVLHEHGIETTVDRVAKKARIRDWIQNSVIAEEDETENDENLSNGMYHSDEEETHQMRNGIHPLEKNNQRWSSLRYTDEKHINPRTGEVLNTTAKETNYNSTVNMSYDMQQIQPLISSDVTVRYNVSKDESPSQGSMKDSAYGSIDFRAASMNALPSEQALPNGVPHDRHVPPNAPYPSQQLQQHFQKQSSIKGSNTMLPPPQPLQNPLNHHNKKTSQPNNKIISNGNLKSSKNSPFTSSDLKSSQTKLQYRSASTSTSTLAKLTPQTVNGSKQNGISSPNKNNNQNSFAPMKRVYDSTNGNVNANPNNNNYNPKTDVENSEENYSLNIVQGQMRIDPHASIPTTSNFVNGRAMNPHMLQLGGLQNGNQSMSNPYLDENDQNSLMQIKKILIENKTGLPE